MLERLWAHTALSSPVATYEESFSVLKQMKKLKSILFVKDTRQNRKKVSKMLRTKPRLSRFHILSRKQSYWWRKRPCINSGNRTQQREQCSVVAVQNGTVFLALFFVLRSVLFLCRLLKGCCARCRNQTDFLAGFVFKAKGGNIRSWKKDLTKQFGSKWNLLVFPYSKIYRYTSFVQFTLLWE